MKCMSSAKVFLARPKLLTTRQHFSLQAVLKKIPEEARVETAEMREDSIHLVKHDEECAPTWKKITKKEDVEGWLFR